MMANVNTDQKLDQKFSAFVKRRFRKNRLAMVAFYFTICLAGMAIFADFIANDKPLVAKIDGTYHFPVAKQYFIDMGFAGRSERLSNPEWREISYDFVVWPPIPYLPRTIDKNAAGVKPFSNKENSSFQWSHWFGTDLIGRDVLAGMIHGTRIAFSVGIISMGIASFLGIFFGLMAGYYGDNRFRISRARLLLNILFVMLAIFYGFGVRSFVLHDALRSSFFMFFGEFLISILIFLFILLIGNLAVLPLKKIKYLSVKVTIPIDILISRLIEIIITIPRLFLIISLIAIAKPSIFIVMIVIGLTSWTGIARFIRAEMLRIRTMGYIEAAHVMGFSDLRTIVKHALPNGITPVIIAITFGMAAAILIESTLSFLGIGVTPDVVTWGSLLSKAREAWWLALFPGIAIFMTITFFNLIGEGLSEALDPKMQR